VKRKRKRPTAQETVVVVTTAESRLTTRLQTTLRPSDDQELRDTLKATFEEHDVEQLKYEVDNPDYHKQLRKAQQRGLRMPRGQPPLYETRTLFTNDTFDMTVRKLSCLQPGVWLNDEVINSYFDMIRTRSTTAVTVWNRTHSPPKKNSLFLSSFFVAKLLEGGRYNYDYVRRWTKRCNIFEMDKIFLPINHENNHWVLVVVFMMFKEIHIYDR